MGVLAGRAEAPIVAPAPATRRRVARLALVAPATAGLLVVAVMLPVGDFRANAAWGAFARGEFALAANRYGDAAGIDPLERHYQRREAEAWLAAGAGGDPDALHRAEAALQRLDEGFGFSYGEAIALATARIGLREAPDRILPVIERALSLNPHGVAMESYTATLRSAAALGGTLEYSERDRWVHVVPNAPLTSP